MNREELDVVLAEHKKWIRGDGGRRADLSWANLYEADLYEADLREADLREADLGGANLGRANLSGANLSGTNLRMANLSGTDLSGADIDYSCWGLSCKTKHVKVDRQIAAQLAAHFCVLDCDDPDYIKARKAILKFAQTSHRAKDLGLVEAA